MSDVTRLLTAIQQGDAPAGEDLLPLVYAELRQLARAKMAREQAEHTLQPTALVHEAWLRLGQQKFENRAHFFGAAAEAMRRILVERARRRLAAKRGERDEAVRVEDLELSIAAQDDQLLAVDDALARFAVIDPRK